MQFHSTMFTNIGPISGQCSLFIPSEKTKKERFFSVFRVSKMETLAINGLRIQLKAFDNFKNKQQKCRKLCFLVCKSMYIVKVYLIHYILRKNTNVEKEFPLDKINGTKNAFIFPFASTNTWRFHFSFGNFVWAEAKDSSL